MNFLLTGATGFVGSHTAVVLLNAGHDVTIVDNLSNSSPAVLERLAAITGRRPIFHKFDLLDFQALRSVFEAHAFDGVFHFAGLKAVGESEAIPLAYYHNNLGGTLNLCRLMREFGVYRLVFSSSATVYGDANPSPVAETAPTAPTNPYGRSKRMIETILEDLARSDAAFRICLLRYFNPVGAHDSGLIGEDPRGMPNNLMPYIAQVAVGRQPVLKVFGNDYPTADGTGVRDYVHVMDLAEGHVKAIERIEHFQGVEVYNLGTGRGHSVLELVRAFAQASGRKIPYRFVDRRPGDVAVLYADAAKARVELNWTAMRDLGRICADVWRWQSQNCNGYPS
jgi:UDP-glucose 4-epimerase